MGTSSTPSGSSESNLIVTLTTSSFSAYFSLDANSEISTVTVTNKNVISKVMSYKCAF